MDCLSSWMEKESLREDMHLCVMYLCTKLVLLVQTLPALGFGTLHVGIVNGF